MKRYILALTCALALTFTFARSAEAVVDVSLNIVYNNPADPTQGGDWTLVAKTDTPNSDGIVALVTRFSDIPAMGTVNPLIGHDINGGELVVGLFDHDNDTNTPDVVEFVYGQNEDPNVMPAGFIEGVGLPTSPSNLPNDPLGDNLNWANSSVIATGSIPDLTILPTFVSADANDVINGTVFSAIIGKMVVRIPEPGAVLLATMGSVGLALRRRRPPGVS